MRISVLVKSAGRVLALTLILVFCFVVAAIISGVSEPSAGSSGGTFLPILFSSFLQASVLSYLIIRSRIYGWKLVGVLFLAFYGSMTVIPQLESIVYLQGKMPDGMISRLFLMGSIVAVLFTPAAVVIWGKLRRPAALDYRGTLPSLTVAEWVWKLAGLAAVYLLLYYGFGYYVAWKNPAVQEYYGGTDPGSFIAQLYSVWEDTPWMYPFQAFRALLWIAILIPLARILKGQPWENGLQMGLFLSVWSTQLLLPNPYMPEEVSSIHFLETITSNFIFGWILGWVLSRHHSSFSDLFVGISKPPNNAKNDSLTGPASPG